GFAVSGEEFLQPGQPLVLADRGTGPRGAVADLDAGVEAGLPGEDEERADEVAGRGPGGEVGIDVLLSARCRGALVGRVEPGQELGGLGDLLLGGVDRSLRGAAGGGLGADAVEMVPGGELLDRLRDVARQRGELALDPGLEAREVEVALGEQAVVDEQGTEVLDVVAAVLGVESVVGHGRLTGGEGAEEFLDLGGALPGEDALRSLGGAEGVDQSSHEFGLGGGGDELGGEVLAQGAAGAEAAAAVELSLVPAPGAVEVLDDAGAGSAGRRAVLTGRAGGQSVLGAGGAGAGGARDPG